MQPSVMINSNNIHPSDIILDSNNNETPEHRFGAGKKYDSGLGILSPQSEESFSNMFPNTEYCHTNNCYNTINFPIAATEMNSPEKQWNSLGMTHRDTSQKSDLPPGNIIELKTFDPNNNMPTSIVIYRNDNRDFRHINIIDYRPKRTKYICRSNTFSNDNDNDNQNISPKKELWRSTDNITCTQSNNPTDVLCNNLSSGSFLSMRAQVPSNEEKHTSDAVKSKSKLMQKLVSTLCCQKHQPGSETSIEEIDTCFTRCPDWKFCMDEFDDLTYFNSGAQGTIYTAKFKDATVALKKVKDNVKRDEIHIEHLLALNHVNIIKFIGVCEEPENYLVMEFCSQGQLFQWLRRDWPISAQDVSSWAHQICDGMAYLHMQDIIHRDLKSPNILITDNNLLKIIDFEFSKDCCENTMLDSFVGTMAWMAPEVLRQEMQTKKVDVWSYGVVLWELITREIPFLEIDRMAILVGVGNNCLSLPLCSSIPVELKGLLSSCWEKSPGNRPEFEEILKNFDNYFDSLKHYSQEEFESMQLKWKLEIQTEFQEMNKEKVSTSIVEAELIRRRTKELYDAKSIKGLYSDKLQRADKLIELLYKCLDAVEDERKKIEREWKLIRKAKQTLSTTSTTHVNNSTFFSLHFPNDVRNQRVPLDRGHKTTSPNHVPKKDRIQNRHSVFEPGRDGEKINRDRVKHSVPSSKTKFPVDVNNKEKRTTRSRPNNSYSLEAVTDDRQRVGGTKRWNQNSSPRCNIASSTLPSPNRSYSHVDDCNAAVNPSFHCSSESFTDFRELQMINSNLLQLAYFGNSASITDTNNVGENMTDSLNTGPSHSLFRHNLMEEYISESPHNHEYHSMEEINEDIHENDNDVVMLREHSGRRKISSSNSLIDSLDVSMLNSQSLTPHSLIEKETLAQGLIKPHPFLAGVNAHSVPDNGNG